MRECVVAAVAAGASCRAAAARVNDVGASGTMIADTRCVLTAACSVALP